MFKMEVFDSDFVTYGQINDFSSASYTKKFNSIGSFELWCPKTKENIDLIKRDRIIWFEDNIAGIIQYMQKEGSQITVKGNLTAGILKTRCIYPTIFVQNVNAAEAASIFAYKSCFYNDKIGNNLNYWRRIYNFKLKEQDYSEFGGEKFDTQATGVMLDAKLEDLAQANNFGFDVGFDPKNKFFIFEILKSTNRTIGQKDNPPVELSSDLSNILSSSYTLNSSDYFNVFISAGQGEGDLRKWVLYDAEGKQTYGFGRKEYFVDAKDISNQNEDGSTMSDQEYEQLLMNRAIEKSSEHSLSESYDAEVSQDVGPFIFGKDYFLGDVVSIIDKEIGVTLDAQISEYTKTLSKTGESISIVYGYGKPFLINSLKRKGVI